MISHKRAIRHSFHALGGLHLVRYLNRRRVRILMYHRFARAEEASFRRQCAYIARHYRAVSLGETVAALHGGPSLPDDATIITVDDGYRDFYEVAYPVLRAYGLPATVFLVTDFVDGKDWLWLDKVRYCVRRTRTPRLELRLPAAPLMRFELTSDVQRDTAISVIKEAAKKLPNQARLAAMRELAQASETELPVAAPDEYAPLSWEMVGTMSKNGIEFGAHTRSHPILTRMESETRMREEIGGSKTRLEEETQAPVRHFSYPNGEWDERTDRLVRQAGFTSAVTVCPGLNPVRPDPFHLRRISIEPRWSDSDFRHYSAGPF